MASLKSEPAYKLINRIPGSCVLISSLPGSALRRHVESLSKPHDSTRVVKVSKGAKIMNRYNRVPHLTQDTNWKVINSQLYTTNNSQAVIPFPAGDHKAQINRCA